MEIPPADQSVNKIVSIFHEINSDNQPVSPGVGIVIAPPPEIKIAWNNIVLTKEQIYLDMFLLRGYTRKATGDINMPNAKGSSKMSDAKGSIRMSSMPKRGGFGKPSFASHTHKINSGYKADISGDYKADVRGDYYESLMLVDVGLKVGDLVSVFPLAGGQQFMILGKLAYMGKYIEQLSETEGGGFNVRDFIG